MAYQKTNWANGRSPAINADNLNKLETALFNLNNDVDTLNSKSVLTQNVLHDADLDTLEESGIYAIVSNYSYTNCPVTAGAILIVTRVSSAAIYQNIFSKNQGSFMRSKMSSTGVWSTWGSIVTDTVDGMRLSAKQSSTEGFSTLTITGANSSKSVDIPVYALDQVDTDTITNLVVDYINEIGDGNTGEVLTKTDDGFEWAPPEFNPVVVGEVLEL